MDRHKEALNTPVVMISMSRWDGEYSSAALSLAKEFAKARKVYYLDQPFTWFDFIRNFRSKPIQRRLRPLILGSNIYTQPYDQLPNFVVVTPKVMLPVNWLSPGSIYRFFLKWNNVLFFKTVRRLIKENNLGEFIYFNSYNPFYGRYLPGDIKPLRFVYQSRDDISVSGYVSKHGVLLEQEAIMNSDVAMATSKELTKKLSRFGKKITQLPNAADVSIFQPDENGALDRPKELMGVPGPVIGYTGNLDSRVDYELLYEIITKNKDKTILIVGPRNDGGQHNYRLEDFPNVIFTGSKRLSDLPAYLSFTDVAIIPFKVNTLTKSIYPLKINEYLAVGKPVVTTDFSEDLADFRECVYLSGSTAVFLDNIEKALERKHDEVDKRIAKARSNSWEARVKLFWKIVKEENGQKPVDY